MALTMLITNRKEVEYKFAYEHKNRTLLRVQEGYGTTFVQIGIKAGN